MKQILDLVIPEHALVLDIFFLGKILDHQDGLIGDLRLFDPEFKIFFAGGVEPVKAYEFVLLGFHYFGLFKAAVPSKIEDAISFIYLVSEPFGQSGGGAQEFIKD